MHWSVISHLSETFRVTQFKFFTECNKVLFYLSVYARNPQYFIIATELCCRREMAYLVGLPMIDIIIAYRVGRSGRLSQGNTIRTTLCLLIARTPATFRPRRLRVPSPCRDPNSSSKLSIYQHKISIPLLKKILLQLHNFCNILLSDRKRYDNIIL